MNLDVSEDESNVDHFDTMNENSNKKNNNNELRRRGVNPGLIRGKYKRMGKEKERELEAAQERSSAWRAVGPWKRPSGSVSAPLTAGSIDQNQPPKAQGRCPLEVTGNEINRLLGYLEGNPLLL